MGLLIGRREQSQKGYLSWKWANQTDMSWKTARQELARYSVGALTSLSSLY